MLTGHTNILQKIHRLEIDRDLQILELYPETHGFSDMYVQKILELDHMGNFKAEMERAGQDIIKIREMEKLRENE